jgi:hypothetical protein
VLEPLLDLDPELTLPDDTPLAPLLDSVSNQLVRRVGPFDRAASGRPGACGGPGA